MEHGKKRIIFIIIALLMISLLSGCILDRGSETKIENNLIELTWYQIGDKQKDDTLVLEEVNKYLAEKIGVKLNIIKVGGGDYNKKMQVRIATDAEWDLCFTSSWANDYLQNARKGVFLELDEWLKKEGRDMYERIDERFWEAAKVGGKIYGIPSEKEIASCPMWVFTKEYIDKYDIPYEDIHTLEDLEPWLQLIKEKESDVIPMYLTKEYSAPSYMDKIVDPVGIEYGDDTLTVKNLFDTEKMISTLQTMRKYYKAGYINEDAALASDDKSIKRFVTKGDGQPYAEIVWGQDLGYDVVVSPIMDAQITNASARGAMTAINKHSKNIQKAVEFLNLVNTDEYLRNLLNYGIEGVHWQKEKVSEEEAESFKGRLYVSDYKVIPKEGRSRDYSVPYWVQGGLFNTYVLQKEPADKWSVFKDFNDASLEAPSFGFDFNPESVSKEIAGFRNVLDEFGNALYTGSVDPDVYVPKLKKKLELTGIDKVIEEMQKQVDEWKKTK